MKTSNPRCQSFADVASRFDGKTITIKTDFIPKQSCVISIGRYSTTENTALSLSTDEGPLCTCSVNMANYGSLSPDELFIKDWSENSGMVQALVTAKVILPLPIVEQRSGFVVARCYVLNPDFVGE